MTILRLFIMVLILMFNGSVFAQRAGHRAPEWAPIGAGRVTLAELFAGVRSGSCHRGTARGTTPHYTRGDLWHWRGH